MLRAKEQALETTSHELKVKTAAIQLLEQKVMSSETQCTSAQRELAARDEQLTVLESELAIRSRRLADLETDGSAAQQQVSALQSIIATQRDELRTGQQAPGGLEGGNPGLAGAYCATERGPRRPGLPACPDGEVRSYCPRGRVHLEVEAQ